MAIPPLLLLQLLLLQLVGAHFEDAAVEVYVGAYCVSNYMQVSAFSTHPWAGRG